MISQKKIAQLANRLYSEQGGRRIPEDVLEKDYCLAWFLVGLSRSSLRERLIFKGGTALKRCYFGEYRFSEDLDFTLVQGQETAFEKIQEGFEEIYQEVRLGSGVSFEFLQREPKHQNSYTSYLGYKGPLYGSSVKRVKVDITIQEGLVCPIQELSVLRGYEEYDDLPEDAVILGYSLSEIAVEKLVALTDRARNEPRDLYDLWFLTSEGHVDFLMLHQELEQKLASRERTKDKLKEDLSRKEARLKKFWEARLRSQMADLPHFDEVYRELCRLLREAQLFE